MEQAFGSYFHATSIYIPQSVKSIGNYAFPSGDAITDVRVLSPIAIGNKVFRNDLPNAKFYIEDIMKVPASLRKNAAIGFVEEFDQASEFRCQGHLKYIKANAAKLVDTAIENPQLLRIMCVEKLISAKNVDAFLEAAQNSGDIELTALILNYIGTTVSTKEMTLDKLANL